MAILDESGGDSNPVVAIENSQIEYGLHMMTRRQSIFGITTQIVAATVAQPILPLFAQSSSVRPLLTADYLSTIDAIEGEPLPFGASMPPGFVPWQLTAPRPVALWPQDDKSIDYRHLHAPMVNSVFQLSAERLRDLFVANSFPIETQDERILFGLRGCSLVGPAPNPKQFAGALALQEDRPDYIEARCVIGVLSLEPLGIWATSGSTVPGIDRLYEAAKDGRPANLLPTGAHRYRIGVHGGTNASRRAWQPGAFLQESPVAVLRAHGNLSYSIPDQKWDVGVGIPHDNIHAAVRDTRAAGPPYFSSAGCQTVPGDYNLARNSPLGAFADLREAAGLRTVLTFTNSAASATLDDGRRFLYVLLTGREARLASQSGDLTALRRLRFGSHGEIVAALRNALAQEPGTTFDQQTMAALINAQIARTGVADAIVTQDFAGHIGMTL